jgi:hypothetical protein
MIPLLLLIPIQATRRRCRPLRDLPSMSRVPIYLDLSRNGTSLFFIQYNLYNLWTPHSTWSIRPKNHRILFLPLPGMYSMHFQVMAVGNFSCNINAEYAVSWVCSLAPGGATCVLACWAGSETLEKSCVYDTVGRAAVLWLVALALVLMAQGNTYDHSFSLPCLWESFESDLQGNSVPVSGHDGLHFPGLADI